MQINILIVDDHPAVGIGTKDMLERNMNVRVQFVHSAKLAIELLRKQKYDAVLCDWQLPFNDGIQLTRQFISMQPELKVMIYSGYELESQFNEMMDAGVSGFMSKSSSSDELVQAIQNMLHGYIIVPVSLMQRLRTMELKPIHDLIQKNHSYITDKEIELLKAISHGYSNKELAEKFHISQRGVEYQLNKLFGKLQVHSRTKAISVAIALGYITARTMDSESI